MAKDVPCCEPMFWAYVVISVSLVVFAGLMSGLTLGLMSLSILDLEVLAKAGQPNDKKNAEKILPIVRNQHLLLCTLLICNAVAMEALPIFLDAIVLPWCAILVSVTLILAFGEIIPQSVCSRYGLAVGAKLSMVVRLLVIVVYPVAYPLSKCLDLILGKDHTVLLCRAELKTLVNMHGSKAGKGGELTNDETNIITGALDLTHKSVQDAMTPMSKIFSLELNTKLNEETMDLILSKGHSRIPVYSERPTNIIGLVLVKNLIQCHSEDETPINNLKIRKIPRVHDGLPLYEMLELFQKGHSHMALVVKSEVTAENATPKNERVQYGQKKQLHRLRSTSSVTSSDNDRHSPGLDQKIATNVLNSYLNPKEEVIGLITMEDVLEQLLQHTILDETDVRVDVHNRTYFSMSPSMKSPFRSPGAASMSQLKWDTMVASPLSSASRTPISSYHHTPVLRSPLSPSIQSPFTRATLSTSPGKFKLHSPVAPIGGSPSSHQMSSKTRS